MIRSEHQVKRELERVIAIEKQYENSKDKDDKRYWLEAFYRRQALEWVLCK